MEKFLNESYTCYHAALNGAAMLAAAGFEPLAEGKAMPKGKGVYRVCGGSLFAVRPGNDSMLLVLAHTDSPSLRVRIHAKDDGTAGNPVLLDTEKYGGGLWRSFLDRKLKVAGRVTVKEGNRLVERTVCSDFNVTIPSVAVHLGGGSEGETLSVSRDLRPLMGVRGNLFAALGVPDALDGDLFCVPAEAAFSCGADGEYLCAPRIDNLASVYAAVQALIACDNKATCVVACFNSEETGSETREGALSVLLERFLADTLGADRAEKSLRHAFAISCDGAHAVHPSHPEKHVSDPPVLGGGVVIKRNDRYASDGRSAGVVREVFASASLGTQTYYHHPDLRCGSTIGLMAARSLGVTTCDVGVAQLAMHAASETAAKQDMADLQKGLTAFFGKDIFVTEESITIG